MKSARLRRRLAALFAANLALLGACEASAFFVLPRTHTGRLVMNTNMGTTPRSLIAGTFSWNEVLEESMAAWNDVGIGPGQDRDFFRIRSPLVVGDPCEADSINEVRFASTDCGEEFGTTLALTRSWVSTSTGIVREVDMIFDTSRSWDLYEGNLRLATGGGILQDLYRVAVHEFGHAIGLDHPDDHGQTVGAIMNARVSNTDRLQADDIAGARAIAWGTASPQPPSNPTAPPASTIGTRGVVTQAATMYGGFTLANSANVMIAVRGPSLQTLGITQDPLDAPTLRLYDAAGNDIIVGSGGTRGVTSCPAGSATAAHYANVRNAPLNARDSCDSRNLAAGVYTFSIAPSADAVGETLFEVLFNPQGTRSTPLRTTGSRGTVTRTATMFGGFTLESAASVEIAVRGPSLQTLGITQNPLDSPGLRVFNAAGADLLLNSRGGTGVNACAATHETAVRYAAAGQPLNPRDSCASLELPAGTYTFTIEPSSSDFNGEVLFEVSLLQR